MTFNQGCTIDKSVNNISEADALRVSDALLTLQTFLSKARGKVLLLSENPSISSVNNMKIIMKESQNLITETQIALNKWETYYSNLGQTDLPEVSNYTILSNQFESSLTSELSKFQQMEQFIKSIETQIQKQQRNKTQNFQETLLTLYGNQSGLNQENNKQGELQQLNEKHETLKKKKKVSIPDYILSLEDTFQHEEKEGLLNQEHDFQCHADETEKKMNVLNDSYLVQKKSNKNQSISSDTSPHYTEPPHLSTDTLYYEQIDLYDSRQYQEHFDSVKKPTSMSYNTCLSYDDASQSTVATSTHSLVQQQEKQDQFIENDYQKEDHTCDNIMDEELTHLLQRPSDAKMSTYLKGWKSPGSPVEETSLQNYVSREKAQGMERIRTQAAQLFQVFREFSHLMSEQQDDLDLFDDTLIQIKRSSMNAVDELRKANQRKQRARKRKVICIATTVVIGLIFIFIMSIPTTALRTLTR